MEKIQKEALQVTKEIVVKFVEAGRVTPANFPDTFPAVYSVVLNTLAGASGLPALPEQPGLADGAGGAGESGWPDARNAKKRPGRRETAGENLE